MNLGEFLEHHQGIEVAEALAAIALVDIDAEKAHPAQLPKPLARQRGVALLHFRRQRPQLAIGKIAREFLKLPLVWRQLEQHLVHCMNIEFIR